MGHLTDHVLPDVQRTIVLYIKKDRVSGEDFSSFYFLDFLLILIFIPINLLFYHQIKLLYICFVYFFT
jgi:hypothetical protein